MTEINDHKKIILRNALVRIRTLAKLERYEEVAGTAQRLAGIYHCWANIKKSKEEVK